MQQEVFGPGDHRQRTDPSSSTLASIHGVELSGLKVNADSTHEMLFWYLLDEGRLWSCTRRSFW